MRKGARDFDEYFEDFPAEVRQRLEDLRATIQAAAPTANEAISYAIPTFKQKGKNLVHFAAYARHIGFYPGARALEVFANELSDYKTSKGAVQFPHDRPLPLALVTRVVEFCLKPRSEGAFQLPQG